MGLYLSPFSRLAWGFQVPTNSGPGGPLRKRALWPVGDPSPGRCKVPNLYAIVGQFYGFYPPRAARPPSESTIHSHPHVASTPRWGRNLFLVEKASAAEHKLLHSLPLLCDMEIVVSMYGQRADGWENRAEKTI